MDSIYNPMKKMWNGLQPIFLFSSAGLYFLALFAIIGNAYQYEEYLPEGKITLNTVGYLVSIFVYPWLISVLEFDSKFARRSLKIMKGLSIGFTGFAAIMWYTNAQNPYLEAATIIIGFTTAIINSSQKNLEDKLPSFEIQETT